MGKKDFNQKRRFFAQKGKLQNKNAQVGVAK